MLGEFMRRGGRAIHIYIYYLNWTKGGGAVVPNSMLVVMGFDLKLAVVPTLHKFVPSRELASWNYKSTVSVFTVSCFGVSDESLEAIIR